MSIAEQVESIERTNTELQDRIEILESTLNISRNNNNNLQARIADLERQLAEANTRLFNQSEIQRYAANNKPRTYTAREWLERTLPDGGEWHPSSDGEIMWWFSDCKWNGTRFGVTFNIDGTIHGGAVNPADIKSVYRATAIDLMVKAIEGEQSGDEPAFKVGDRVKAAMSGPQGANGTVVDVFHNEHEPHQFKVEFDDDDNAEYFVAAQLKPAIAIIEQHKAVQAQPAMPECTPVGRREDIVAAMEQIAKTPYSTCQPAPAFKVGDRVEVDMEGNEWHRQIGVVKRTQSSVADVQLSHSTSEVFPFSYLRPAPAEQKPEAAKVDTLEAIVNALKRCNGPTWEPDIANAIDAHMRAVALSLLDGKGESNE